MTPLVLKSVRCLYFAYKPMNTAIELFPENHIRPIVVGGNNQVKFCMKQNIPYLIISGRCSIIADCQIDNFFNVLEQRGVITNN